MTYLVDDFYPPWRVRHKGKERYSAIICLQPPHGTMKITLSRIIEKYYVSPIRGHFQYFIVTRAIGILF